MFVPILGEWAGQHFMKQNNSNLSSEQLISWWANIAKGTHKRQQQANITKELVEQGGHHANPTLQPGSMVPQLPTAPTAAHSTLL